jgi:hypothetical protein
MENFEESNLGEFLSRLESKKEHIPNLGAYEMDIKWLYLSETSHIDLGTYEMDLGTYEMGQLPGDSR